MVHCTAQQFLQIESRNPLEHLPRLFKTNNDVRDQKKSVRFGDITPRLSTFSLKYFLLPINVDYTLLFSFPQTLISGHLHPHKLYYISIRQFDV